MSFRHLAWRDRILVLLVIAALVAAALSISRYFILPIPPRSVTVSTGAPDGAAHRFAERLRRWVATEGVELVLLPSAGAAENIARLNDEAANVPVAFVQSGVATREEASALEAVAGLYYEPVWVFYRAPRPLAHIGELKGRRIAVGAVGSGTRHVALELLDAVGVRAGNATLLDLAPQDAAAALAAHRIDALFTVSGEQAPHIQTLLADAATRLMPFPQADAMAKRFKYLTPVTLPRGIVDLQRDQPSADVPLLAAISQLAVREDIHPALLSLLAQAAQDLASGASWFHRQGEFPTVRNLDLELNEDAAHTLKSGAPFLQRHLPFWVAVWVERLLVLLVPLAALLLPLSRVLPPLYRWRMRSRIYRWYSELGRIEVELAQADPTARPRVLAALAVLDASVRSVKVPLAFQHELYGLRQHLQMVRAAVDGGAEKGPADR